jgi:hypothetical protein
MLQHIGMGTQLEAVDRRVADNALAKAPEARVVVNDAEVARQGEELVQAAHDHHVQVQEQRLPLRPCRSRSKVVSFFQAPSRWPGARCMFSGGMGKHSTSERIPAVVGQADKAKISAEMAAHHGVESVDVLRAVFGAPFHAKNVPLALISHASGAIKSVVPGLLDRLLLDRRA